MATKPRSRKRLTLKGPKGPQGRARTRGGAAAARPNGNHTRAIAGLSAQVEQIVKELQVQLTRIAQLQAQLDRVVREQDTEPPEERSERRERN